MVSDSFWQVEVGRGMGPLSFGMSREEVFRCLRSENIEASYDALDQDPELYVEQIESMLVFTSRLPGTLVRIDVDDDRINFAKWDVINKPIHKVVRLFKSADEDTLWCRNFDEKSQNELATGLHKDTLESGPSNSDLLRRGTLWIPALGLGFSLDEGLVSTVHVCDPAFSPKYGTGTWNTAQRVMSETGHIAAVKLEPHRRSPASKLLTIALAIAMGIVAWQGIAMQLRWNGQPDITAVVVAIDPPPPAPFGDQFTVEFTDADGKQHQVALGRMEFYTQPTMNEEVKIRYLPESPDKPLGPRRIADAGMNFAVPRMLAVFAIYVVITAVLLVTTWFSKRNRVK